MLVAHWPGGCIASPRDQRAGEDLGHGEQRKLLAVPGLVVGRGVQPIGLHVAEAVLVAGQSDGAVYRRCCKLIRALVVGGHHTGRHRLGRLDRVASNCGRGGVERRDDEPAARVVQVEAAGHRIAPRQVGTDRGRRATIAFARRPRGLADQHVALKRHVGVLAPMRQPWSKQAIGVGARRHDKSDCSVGVGGAGVRRGLPRAVGARHTT